LTAVNRSARIFAVVGTIVVLIVAFVVLRPGSSDKTATTTTTTAGDTTTTNPAAPPQPQYTTIVVRGGKPVGGVKKIELTKGEQALIAVSSPDTTSEIHLHGYDLKRDLKAGGSVRFSFVASTDGIYEIELEGASEQIASLVVEP
jgi:hypothetical protein